MAFVWGSNDGALVVVFVVVVVVVVVVVILPQVRTLQVHRMWLRRA